MRTLKVVVFLLTFLCLSAQLIRHIYVRWVQEQGSVLDKYARAVHQEIRNATSLQALDKLYAAAVKKAREEAAKAAKTRPQPAENPCDYSEPQDPANSSMEVLALRTAIEDWERKSNEVREVRFYWAWGFLAVALAAVCHRRGWQWAAMALLLLGFSEMEWWTSPSFMGGAQQEFTRLLDNKILFTILSLTVLFWSWLWGPLRLNAALRQDRA
jgi:hypothetical protein